MKRAAILAIWLATLAGSGLAADDVTVRLTADHAFDESVVGVLVEVGEVDGGFAGMRLVVPEGFKVEGPIERGSSTTIINGVSRSVTQYVFRISPPSGASGSYEIGPLVVLKESGDRVELPVGSLEVGERPESGVEMEVRAVPPSGPVGMPFTVTYRILYSGDPHEERDVFGEVRRPFGLTSLSLAVLGAPGVRAEPLAAPEGAVSRTVQLGGTPLVLASGQTRRDGRLYRTVDIRLRVTPLTTGSIDLSGNARMVLVVGTEKRRDFFGRIVEVPRAEERRASTAEASYRVEDLPAEGRPPGFSGAVGRFTIEAEPATREASAFDPIDVKVTIRGEGALERVSLPRWSALPEISTDFEIDADVDPGVVEGDAKVFTAVFRARSSAVTRLPSLPFPFYDPWEKRFVVARSAPVPLGIRDVRTVRPEEAVGAPSAGAPAADAPIARRIGIGANFETLDAGDGSLAAAPGLLTPGFLALLLVPPVLAALLALLDLRRSRPREAPRGTPLSRARAGCVPGSSAESAAAAFSGYFRERLELGAGELTTAEVERALIARSVPPEIVSRVARAHEALTAARFAGGAGSPGGLDALLSEVDRCLS